MAALQVPMICDMARSLEPADFRSLRIGPVAAAAGRQGRHRQITPHALKRLSHYATNYSTRS